jgi:hypothetical protein
VVLTGDLIRPIDQVSLNVMQLEDLDVATNRRMHYFNQRSCLYPPCLSFSEIEECMPAMLRIGDGVDED